jgi:hypothetical protein
MATLLPYSPSIVPIAVLIAPSIIVTLALPVMELSKIGLMVNAWAAEKLIVRAAMATGPTRTRS